MKKLRIFLENVLIFLVIRALHASYRYKVVGFENRQKAMAFQKQGAIAYATWHGNSLVGTMAHANQKVRPICSPSRDGSLVAFICERIGMWPARGSSSRGGKEAREDVLSTFSEGYAVGITVDGPRGPLHVVKPGVIDLARKGQIAITPLCAKAKGAWRLRSWDRLEVPKPFSRVYVNYGPMITVPPQCEGSDFEDKRLEVEVALHKMEKDFVEKFG